MSGGLWSIKGGGEGTWLVSLRVMNVERDRCDKGNIAEVEKVDCGGMEV